MARLGRADLTLPAGVADPLWECELALELGMPVGELYQRMSAHELTVTWPLFFAYRRRQQTRDAKDAEKQARARSRCG